LTASFKNMGFKKSFETQLDGLGKDEQATLRSALQAVKNSYSPYSNYKVGASLLLENGDFIIGSNQENVAYPSGICAERSALFTYGSSGNTSKIAILAIVAFGKNGDHSETCSPCGACRQVMVEFEQIQKKPYKVIFCYNGKIEVVESSSSLLPFTFHF
jgi:cytidine deaminase